MASVTIARLTGFPPNKVNYSVLPMYHTSGAQFGVGMGLLYGTKVVIREKFSARNFFKDCTKHRVTVSEEKSTKYKFMCLHIPLPLKERCLPWRNMPLLVVHTTIRI